MNVNKMAEAVKKLSFEDQEKVITAIFEARDDEAAEESAAEKLRRESFFEAAKADPQIVEGLKPLKVKLPVETVLTFDYEVTSIPGDAAVEIDVYHTFGDRKDPREVEAIQRGYEARVREAIKRGFALSKEHSVDFGEVFGDLVMFITEQAGYSPRKKRS